MGLISRVSSRTYRFLKMSNRSIQNSNQEELRGEYGMRHRQFYHTSGPGAPMKAASRGRGRGGGRGGGFGGMQSFSRVTRQAPDYSLGGDGRVDVRTQGMIDAHKEAEQTLEKERIEKE